MKVLLFLLCFLLLPATSFAAGNVTVQIAAAYRNNARVRIDDIEDIDMIFPGSDRLFTSHDYMLDENSLSNDSVHVPLKNSHNQEYRLYARAIIEGDADENATGREYLCKAIDGYYTQYFRYNAKLNMTYKMTLHHDIDKDGEDNYYADCKRVS